MRTQMIRAFGGLFLTGTIMILLGSGCASTAKFDYACSPGVKFHATKVQELPAITVLPFVDARPSKFYESRVPDQERGKVPPELLKDVRGAFAMGWLPLLPYAWMSTTEPEDEAITLATLKNYWCKFDRELAEAATDSLKAANCFKEVNFVETPDEVKTRYVFRGVIHSTKYEGIRITYGLTYLVAPVLWAVGAPYAVSKNTLEITFTVVDTQEKHVIWKYRFNGTKNMIHFLYCNLGKDTANYALLMKNAMNAALHDLEMKIADGNQ